MSDAEMAKEQDDNIKNWDSDEGPQDKAHRQEAENLPCPQIDPFTGRCVGYIKVKPKNI